MASSEVDIMNSALIHLGAGFITSRTQNSDAARACNQFYDGSRDALLTQADWSFALEQAVLSKQVAVPEFGFAYQYTLPTFPYCLKPLFIENPEEDTAWRVHGRNLLTDRDGVELQYVARITDVSLHSALFDLAFEFHLAGRMAYALTGSRTVAADMYTMASDLLADAQDVDAQIGTTDGFGADIDVIRR